MASIVHYGPFDDISRSHPTLNFIEKYCKAIDSLNLASIPASAFLSPFAIFHDTKGNVHLTASHIWQLTARQAAPFSQIRHDIVEVRLVGNGDGEGRDVVYCECLAHFRLLGDEDEVLVPSFFCLDRGGGGAWGGHEWEADSGG
ncbi:hypothetical protein LSUB1_G002687 [Lachnellula subtilissima]|uniref:Uncharacterized protein n=1 Tax=Lachnellula subtilissima TaxID=602034 RepID=A0A8H8RUP7_9HELO|nr:hypothetical protein LSUB1_G002687 [Lachnellula subtilissima]